MTRQPLAPKPHAAARAAGRAGTHPARSPGPEAEPAPAGTPRYLGGTAAVRPSSAPAVLQRQPVGPVGEFEDGVRIARMLHRQPQGDAPARHGAPRIVQRKCAACARAEEEGRPAACPDCAAETPRFLQRASTVRLGPARDRFEVEADRVAERVAAGADAGPIFTASAPELRRPVTAYPPAGNRATAAERAAAAVARGGRPLSRAERSYFEPRFGRDLSPVRLHEGARVGSAAAAINARAYTLGTDIALAPGEYSPGASAGRRLLAHELAHTVQQRAIPEAPIQRACGPAAIGSVGGCTGRGGDITDFGGSSDRIFLFEQNCDEFRPGEEARLRGVAAGLSPTSDVDVDGFASEEGDATFNEELSCARANAAAQVLVAEGVAGAIDLFSHGPTPGGREDRRSAVISVSGSPAPEPPTETPEPPGETPEPRPRRPAAETEDCSREQTAMLRSALDDARIWVDDATRKITDFAFVFASSRHSAVPADPATAAIVRQALNDNFHTTASGHVLRIRDGFQELRTELNGSFTFECEDDCEDLAYVRGAFAWIRRLQDIHVCPPWFNCPDHKTRVRTLIHERAHQHPGATDNAYEFEATYATLSPDDAMDNAEFYAVAARQIFHGGAEGPGSGKC